MASRELALAIQLCRHSRHNPGPLVLQLGRLAELRAEYDEISDGDPHRSKINCQVVDAGRMNAEWISTPASDKDRAILYLHGGCYGMGSVQTHRDLMSRIAVEASMRVLGLNYRLAPAHGFPAAVEDAAAAYRWLLGSGLQPGRIAIAGDSAGAGLALAATIMVRDEGLPVPGAILCISPWVDLALSGDSLESKAAEDPIVSREMLLGWAKLYLGAHDPYTPLASPLYAELRGIPPKLIQVGSAEVLLDDSRRLAQRASAMGVDTTLEIWPEMIHVWHSFASILREARQAIEAIGSFVRQHLDR
jgi:epsilon-lactone hydrolase